MTPIKPPTNFDTKAKKAVWDALSPEERQQQTDAFLNTLDAKGKEKFLKTAYVSKSSAAPAAKTDDEPEAVQDLTVEEIPALAAPVVSGADAEIIASCAARNMHYYRPRSGQDIILGGKVVPGAGTYSPVGDDSLDGFVGHFLEKVA